MVGSVVTPPSNSSNESGSGQSELPQPPTLPPSTELQPPGVAEDCSETTGPRVGIQLNLSQANAILKTHLNLSCVSVDYIARGYNNRTYIASADNATDYIIRLCGRFWTKWKTERELATICYIKHKYPDGQIPVPKVYGYASDKEKSCIGMEYLLMEKLPGVPLEEIWEKAEVKLSLEDKEFVVDQIGGILGNMQSLTFDRIGSLAFVPAIADTGGVGINPSVDIRLDDIVIDKHSDIMAGPFDNYISYEKAVVQSAMADLQKTTYMSDSHDLLPRIESFLEQQFKLGSDLFPQPSIASEVNSMKICLVHGDFESCNVMIDPQTLLITGIVDWEFSGAFPYHEDWFAGFESFGAICNEAWTFEEEESDPEDYDPKTPELTTNRELFFRSLQKHGVKSRDEIPHLKLFAELWAFRWNISPWWFDGVEIERIVPETWEEDKQVSRRRVESILQKYGC